MDKRNNACRKFNLVALFLAVCLPTGSPPLGLPAEAQADRQGLSESRINAAMSGNVVAARKALDRGWPINRAMENGETMLTAAAGFGHPGLVRLLLSRGASVNPRGQFGRTALWNAADADLAQTNSGYSPNPVQLQAQTTAYVQIVQMLLAQRADPNIAEDSGITPLDVAAFRGRTRIVAALLQAHADPNLRDRYGKTPIEWAAYEGHPDIAQMLQAHGAWVDSQRGLPGPAQRLRDEALVAALMRQGYGTDTHLAEIKLLLEQGANPNACLVQPDVVPLTTPPEMQDLTTPFLLASAPKTFALMLAHGANPDLTLLGPDTASTRLLLTYDAQKHEGHVTHLADRFVAAAGYGDNALAQMKTLLACDPNIRVAQTAFSDTRSEAALALLLAHGANIDARDKDGRTRLMQIANEYYAEGGVAACDDTWANVLLRHGANPNLQDAQGATPLMLLAAQGEYGEYSSGNPIRFARLLLSHGARLGLTNKKGQTALQIARRSGAKGLAHLLAKNNTSKNHAR